ncbi:MAG: hypothetical protein LBE75_04240 [Burkholderiales bacterium]|jgi:hypothetical protein|nr:hypothetical protein [Burkholderiales bacterium]
MKYRRAWQAGGTYSFTDNLAERKRTLLVDHIEELRNAVRKVKHAIFIPIRSNMVMPCELRNGRIVQYIGTSAGVGCRRIGRRRQRMFFLLGNDDVLGFASSSQPTSLRSPFFVIPAKAGSQAFFLWIPAFAGMMIFYI